MTRQNKLIAEALKATRDSLTVAHTDADNRGIALAAVDSATMRIANRLAGESAAFNYDDFFRVATGR